MEILTICLIILCVVCFFVGRYFASKPIEDKNEEIRKQCQILHDKEVKLELRIKDLTDNIKFKEEQVRAADYKIQSIQKQYEEKLKVIENTKQLADEELKQRKKVLEYEFEQYKIKQEEIKQNIQNEIQNIQNNLESLKSTKAAAIEAARKEQEIQENKSFYTLQIPREEKRDIEILEDTKMRISKPRAISMCIWSNYYLPVAKNKLPQILGKDKVCGIYKITNQKTQECYIGQSVDIKKRIYEHYRAALGIDTPPNNLLYTAMQKDGIENFSIELLLECSIIELNQQEEYFIHLYQSHIYGYNKTKGNKVGVKIDK